MVSRVLCSGSPEAEIKVLAGALVPSEAQNCLPCSLVVARIQFFAAEGLRSLFLVACQLKTVLSSWGLLAILYHAALL